MKRRVPATSSALTADMISRLDADGITPKAVAERLGIGQRAATRLLVAAGAKRSGSTYRRPSAQRVIDAERRLASPVSASGDFGHADFAQRKWSQRTTVTADKRAVL